MRWASGMSSSMQTLPRFPNPRLARVAQPRGVLSRVTGRYVSASSTSGSGRTLPQPPCSRPYAGSGHRRARFPGNRDASLARGPGGRRCRLKNHGARGAFTGGLREISNSDEVMFELGRELGRRPQVQVSTELLTHDLRPPRSVLPRQKIDRRGASQVLIPRT